MKTVSVVLFAFLTSCASTDKIFKTLTGQRSCKACIAPTSAEWTGKPFTDFASEFGEPSFVNQLGPRLFVAYYNYNAYVVHDGTIVELGPIRTGDPTFTIDIKALAAPMKTDLAKNYFIASGMESIPQSDLEFIENTKGIRLVLQEKGGRIVNSPIQADVILMVKYSIDEKVETKRWSEPVYRWVSPNTTTYNISTTHQDALGRSLGQSTSTATTNPYNIGHLQYAGERQKESSTTYFSRYMVLEAIDAKDLVKSNTVTQIWKVVTSSRGSSNDLTRAINAFILATHDYWGKSSGGQATEKIKYSDPGLTVLAEGIPSVANQRLPSSNKSP